MSEWLSYFLTVDSITQDNNEMWQEKTFKKMKKSEKSLIV